MNNSTATDIAMTINDRPTHADHHLTDNGDLDTHWRYHLRREHQRLCPAPHQQGYDLTA